MGDAVTLAAFGEVLMHRRWMRFAMAGGALRHHLMFVLVTGGAGKFCMLGRVALQLVQDIAMAAGAACRRRLGRVADLKRHMGFVAGEAILLDHFFAVR